MASALTNDDLNELRESLAQDDRASVLTRTITKNGIRNSSFDNQAAARLNRTFSVEVETGQVTNQKRSGRCWEFSLLNTLRHQFAKNYKVKDFELSQNYLFFWDKIERANIFYHNVGQTVDKAMDDRFVHMLFNQSGEDGGQWAMAAALVEKYGVMPAYAIPETFNTDNTSDFQEAMNKKLIKDGFQLRNMAKSGSSEDELDQAEKKMLQEVYRMAAYSFGEPAKTFDLEYRDDDKKYHREAALTPQDFFKKYFKVDFDDYAVVTNSPDKAFNQLYSLPSQDNVLGGRDIEFLNVPIDVLEKTAVAQLQSGETVWFGNDVLQQMDRQSGLLDGHLFDESSLFQVDLNMTKAQRLTSGEGTVSHAMTLTGVDLIDGQAAKWKVENSWGDKLGDKGYFVMSPDWFEDYVYEVVVHKDFLPEELKAVLKQQPTVLPAWDPLS
ncbi:MAG: C1 family peptidase [Oenococcus sp.]|uniref:C1 family peptidase n=1 Tax=Oenococcus TaxID=46254 RepID=UPI0021E6DDC8|nr:C1 family peptidase [Oenococcus kitaharae]MCV3295826.1 C1 family peptidase [Oenococcus kitaharae]